MRSLVDRHVCTLWRSAANQRLSNQPKTLSFGDWRIHLYCVCLVLFVCQNPVQNRGSSIELLAFHSRRVRPCADMAFLLIWQRHRIVATSSSYDNCEPCETSSNPHDTWISGPRRFFLPRRSSERFSYRRPQASNSSMISPRARVVVCGESAWRPSNSLMISRTRVSKIGMAQTTPERAKAVKGDFPIFGNFPMSSSVQSVILLPLLTGHAVNLLACSSQ